MKLLMGAETAFLKMSLMFFLEDFVVLNLWSPSRRLHTFRNKRDRIGAELCVLVSLMIMIMHHIVSHRTSGHFVPSLTIDSNNLSLHLHCIKKKVWT